LRRAERLRFGSLRGHAPVARRTGVIEER
jgi:hypothetical protein